MSYDPMRSLRNTLDDLETHINRGEIDDALAACGHALDHAREAGWPEQSLDPPGDQDAPGSGTS